MARNKAPEGSGESRTIARAAVKRVSPAKKSSTSKSATGCPASEAPRPRATLPIITSQERHSMIAVAAYYRAERRGNGAGDPVQDWYEAEAEIDQQFEGTVAI